MDNQSRNPFCFAHGERFKGAYPLQYMILFTLAIASALLMEVAEMRFIGEGLLFASAGAAGGLLWLDTGLKRFNHMEWRTGYILGWLGRLNIDLGIIAMLTLWACTPGMSPVVSAALLVMATLYALAFFVNLNQLILVLRRK